MPTSNWRSPLSLKPESLLKQFARLNLSLFIVSIDSCGKRDQIGSTVVYFISESAMLDVISWTPGNCDSLVPDDARVPQVLDTPPARGLRQTDPFADFRCVDSRHGLQAIEDAACSARSTSSPTLPDRHSSIRP